MKGLPNAKLLKATRALSTLRGLVREWVGSIPVREIHENPEIAKRLEMVERGVRLVESGLEVKP